MTLSNKARASGTSAEVPLAIAFRLDNKQLRSQNMAFKEFLLHRTHGDLPASCLRVSLVSTPQALANEPFVERELTQAEVDRWNQQIVDAGYASTPLEALEVSIAPPPNPLACLVSVKLFIIVQEITTDDPPPKTGRQPWPGTFPFPA